jgi:uncharacterized repeat protein (TIGR03943 family)
MAHDHDHSHDGTYYVDQLCTIAACGALGGVAITMYLDGRLAYILTPFFFLPVLVGGLALVVMVAVRAITLWHEAGAVASQRQAAQDHHHHHDHAHSHDHGHDHDHHDHDHADHAHSHDHDHDHGHDHGWTPWRYAVLMLPIVLFFLNLPNSSFSAMAYEHMMPGEKIEGGAAAVDKKEGLVLGFKELASAAYDPVTRLKMQGQTGRLKGMYSPLGTDKQFTLFRVKMSCCAADAIPVRVLIVCDENITQIRPKEWVEVEGQIQFHKPPGQKEYIPMLYLKSRDQVKSTAPLSDYSYD